MRIVLAAAVLLIGAFSAAASPADPFSRWVNVGGTSIHYLDTGQKDPGAPVLLMVHGWCGSAEDFRSLLALLPRGVRGVSIDLPGSGLSDKPDAPYDIPYFVDLLWQLRGALALDTMILVGHSMGGQFAAHFTARHPEVVTKLILIDPYGLGEERAPLQGVLWLGPLVDIAFHINTRLFIEWGIRGDIFYNPTEELVQALTSSTARSILDFDGARAAARVTRRVIGHGAVDDILPFITQPTLVIWGDNDKVLEPRWSVRFVSLLPYASLGIVSDAGHMPMLENPLDTARMVEAFIGQ